MGRVAREIREEAARRIDGFPKDELRKELGSGWGEEFARQIFGTPGHRRQGRWGS